MNEGELEKQIKILMTNLVNPDGTVKCGYSVADAQEIADLEQFERWINDAKKELCPIFESWFKRLLEDWQGTYAETEIREQYETFKKWLGDVKNE